MIKKMWMLMTIALVPFVFNCQSLQFNSPDTYNFQFIGYNAGIENPSEDKRSFFKVYVDKIEEGRTTTGLDSQKRSYKAKLSTNRHLLKVEKWVLDERAGKYIKLNNIDQPRPNFFYFDVPEDRIVVIELKVKRNGKAEYKKYFEKD